MEAGGEGYTVLRTLLGTQQYTTLQPRHGLRPDTRLA